MMFYVSKEIERKKKIIKRMKGREWKCMEIIKIESFVSL